MITSVNVDVGVTGRPGVPAPTAPAPPQRPGFARPGELACPPGAQGWEGLYSYSLRFGDDPGAPEHDQFWFHDSVHWPHVVAPFDATLLQYALGSLGQANTRLLSLPTSFGFDYRIVNGYAYLTTLGVEDPVVVARRQAHFAQRAEPVFADWERYGRDWVRRAEGLVARIATVRFDQPPELVALERVVPVPEPAPLVGLARAWHELLDLGLELWQHHFQLLSLGYGAQLAFFELAGELVPGADAQVLARLAGDDQPELYRPDEELRRLARLAVDLGVDAIVCRGAWSLVEGFLGATVRGRRWLGEFEAVRRTWLDYSTGTGFHHADAVWSDHPDIPLGICRTYINRLRAGAGIDPPAAAMAAERERLTAEVVGAVPAERRAEFLDGLALARRASHHVEGHNLYVEQRGHSALWRKVRELSRLFVAAGVWPDVDDIFMLRREEVDEAVWDLANAWALGRPPKGRQHWPAEVARRRGILQALAAWAPPPALGRPPRSIADPIALMLLGLTDDAVARWAAGPAGGVVTGCPASAGVVEGVVRVVRTVDGLDGVAPGEVLVAPFTTPSWAAGFVAAAVVTDSGGMMSHAAVVCREYGIPAVTATATGTRVLSSGMRVRVDGGAGTVTVLDP